MKQIQGKSFNIVEDVVGRITFGKKMFHRSNEIWVSKDASSPAFGYAATITTKDTISDNGKPYCVVDNVDEFHEGDVVVVNQWKSHATLTPLAKQDCPPLATI